MIRPDFNYAGQEEGRLAKIFVTGGAGYIGSHVVRALGNAGNEVLVYDYLSKGHREAVRRGNLVVGDLADMSRLKAVISGFQPDAVMHFAAFIEVGESALFPIKYYFNNVGNTINLLKVLIQCSIKQFIFSSSAAVYGIHEKTLISESERTKPINSYGETKAVIEKILRDLAATSDFRYVALRYFNAVGACSSGEIGEQHTPESHVIPVILKTAKGERYSFTIFGTDYPTKDGTCIMDYIHVENLVESHLQSLKYLLDNGTSTIFNCGYRHGYSVL